MYTENYKILLKKINESTNKWKGSPYSWDEKLNVEMSILHKAIHRFNAILIEILMAFLAEMLKNLKIHVDD